MIMKLRSDVLLFTEYDIIMQIYKKYCAKQQNIVLKMKNIMINLH